jgi:hypothetical protein
VSARQSCSTSSSMTAIELNDRPDMTASRSARWVPAAEHRERCGTYYADDIVCAVCYHSLKGCSGSWTTWPPRVSSGNGTAMSPKRLHGVWPQTGALHRPGAGVSTALRDGGRGQVLACITV